MGFKTWFKGWFNDASRAGEPSEQPMREAAGASIDVDEPGWRRLTEDAGRDLSPVTQDRMQEMAAYMWQTNPVVNRMIELPLAYLLAEGVSVSVPDEEAQGWVDAFWNDPINRMDVKLPKYVRELALFGEQLWPVFVDPVGGAMRLGYVDPSRIASVITDPDNATQPIGVITKTNRRGEIRKFRVIVSGPETVFSERTQKIREDFADGEAFFYTVNDLAAAARGRSDLLPQIDWADAYDKAMFGELERWDFLRAFIWDVTLKGATAADVEARSKKIVVPSAGGVRVHNDSEEWTAVTPDLKAADGEANARLFRNHLLGGATIPEHWFGGGGDVNRATAGEMGEPTFKVFTMRQRIWKHILEEVVGYQIRRRMRALGVEQLADDSDYQPVAQFPELTARDTTKYAAAIVQVVTACVQAIAGKLMSRETAVALIALVAGQLGLEVDAAAELERVEASLRQAAEDDLFPPDEDEEPDDAA